MKLGIFLVSLNVTGRGAICYLRQIKLSLCRLKEFSTDVVI